MTTRRIEIPMARRILGYDMSYWFYVAGAFGFYFLAEWDSSTSAEQNLLGVVFVAAAVATLWRNLRLEILVTDQNLVIRRLTTKRIGWAEIRGLRIASRDGATKMCLVDLHNGSFHMLPTQSLFWSVPEGVAQQLQRMAPTPLALRDERSE